MLVPLYGSISAGYPGTGSPSEQPLEYLPVPTDKARGGKFALRVAGDSMNRSKEGIQDGDLVLLADPGVARIRAATSWPRWWTAKPA